MVVDVPAVVRNKALAVDAAQWLGGIAELVASLELEWSIAVGRPYDEATEAFVAEATLSDGTPAVLKLLVPRGPDVARKPVGREMLAVADYVGRIQETR